MRKPIKITLIAAINNKRVIGNSGSIPWYNFRDLQHFAETVKDRVIICGRETFYTLPSKYENPRTIVLTRRPTRLAVYKIQYARTLFAAINKARDIIEDFDLDRNIYIVGGGQVYEQALPLANRMILSKINNDSDGDTFFPDFDTNEWKTEHIKNFSDFQIFYLKRR